MLDRITYVTDTHSLLWFLTASPRLGDNAREAFNQVARGEAQLVVPMIVIAELVFIVKSRHAPVDLDDVIQRLDANPAIEITPLTLDVTTTIRSLPSISDIHDRLIVSEAKQRRAKLITRDLEIRNANIVETIW